jgi:hypothetical protein
LLLNPHSSLTLQLPSQKEGSGASVQNLNFGSSTSSLK